MLYMHTYNKHYFYLNESFHVQVHICNCNLSRLVPSIKLVLASDFTVTDICAFPTQINCFPSEHFPLVNNKTIFGRQHLKDQLMTVGYT